MVEKQASVYIDMDVDCDVEYCYRTIRIKFDKPAGGDDAAWSPYMQVLIRKAGWDMDDAGRIFCRKHKPWTQ
jgi:hypothetical protein